MQGQSRLLRRHVVARRRSSLAVLLSLTMTADRRLSYSLVSVVHIVSGLVALLVETLKTALTWREDETLVSFGEGFYCGPVFLAAGVLAAAQQKYTRESLDKVFYTFSIITAVFGGWLVITSGSVLIGSLVHLTHLPAILLHLILFLAASTDMTVTIISSSFSCYKHCRCCYLCCCRGTADLQTELARATFVDNDKTEIVLGKQEAVREVKENLEEVQTISGYARFV